MYLWHLTTENRSWEVTLVLQKQEYFHGKGTKTSLLWSWDISLNVSIPFQTAWSQALEIIQRHVAGSCPIKMWWPQCDNWAFPLQCCVVCHLLPFSFLRRFIMGFWSLTNKAHFTGKPNHQSAERNHLIGTDICYTSSFCFQSCFHAMVY